MCRRSTFVLTLATAAALTDSPTARGANCALRNPDRQIYEIFPDATSYRSMVANVDERLKPAIEAALGSEINFNDLAKHTIFIVLKNDVPIGFIHPRSEIGVHGTVELVWAMDLDLKIRDFRVQRCREKHAEVIAGESFRGALIGRDHRRMQEFLHDANKRVNTAKLPIASDAEPIVHAALLCGAKTLIITEVAFGEELSPLRLLGNAHRFFPAASKVTRLNALLNEASREAAASHLGQAVTRVSGDSVAARAFDPQDRPLGTVVRCQCAGLPAKAEFWVAVTSDGLLNGLVIVGDPGRADPTALSSLHGKRLADLQAITAADDAAGRCAMEVLAILAGHDPGR